MLYQNTIMISFKTGAGEGWKEYPEKCPERVTVKVPEKIAVNNKAILGHDYRTLAGYRETSCFLPRGLVTMRNLKESWR